MGIPQRVERLRLQMGQEDLDAFLITSPENRRYLSGFVGTAGYLYVTQQVALLATDFRYTEQAGLQAPDYKVVQIGFFSIQGAYSFLKASK